MHDVIEVTSVETLGAPHQTIFKRLSTVLLVFQVWVVLPSFLSVPVKSSYWVQTNCTFGQQLHAIKTVHHLRPGVLRKNVVSLHANVGLLGVCRYPFGDREEAEFGFAVAAVDVEGFIHGLFLVFHFHGDALLPEVVLGDASIVDVQQVFIESNKFIEEGSFVVLGVVLPSLNQHLQHQADHPYFLDVIGFVHVVLQDLFSLFAGSKQNDVVQFVDLTILLDHISFEGFKVFGSVELLGVKKPVDDGDLLDVDGLVLVFEEVVFAVAEEDGGSLVVLVFEVVLDELEVV